MLRIRNTFLSVFGLACLQASAANRPAPPFDVRLQRELFVSPTGSSANVGSMDSPWPLKYALSHAGPGSIITLMPGTYGSIDLPDPVAMSGLTLRSRIKWGARIIGSPGMNGITTQPGVSNVVIDGFEIAYSYIDGVKFNDDGSTVRNCWIHHSGKGNPSAVINTDSSFTGQGVAAHNKYGTLIENNLIENCGLWINHDHGIYINGTNNIVRGNVLRGNLAHGVQVYEDEPRAAANCQIYANLIYGNGRGIVIYGQTNCTNYVFNNTVICTNSAVESTPILSRRSGILAATNNIALGNRYSIRSDDNGPGASLIRADYNVVSNPAGGPHDRVASAVGFVAPESGLYWLATVSAARGAANATEIPPVNFFGKVQSGVADAGALQYDSVLASDTRVLDPSGSAGADYWSNIGQTH